MSGPPKAKVSVALDPGLRSDVAAAAVLRALAGAIEGNRAGAMAGEDPEYLHQLRIAVRRSRTVQRQLRRVFPPLLLPGYRSEFKWLQQATGEARDLDVYLLDFEELRTLLPEEMRGDLAPVRTVLAHWRLAAHAQTSRVLASRRVSELLTDWEMLLETLVEAPVHDRPAAADPIAATVGHRVRRVYRRIGKMGAAIGPGSPAADYHELRKKGKELRYLLELFGPQLFDPGAVGELVSSLKELQELLGRHQDREVQTSVLVALADEVAGLPRGPRALMAMGVLVERLRADEIAARAQFADAFSQLASRERRRLVKATFA
ncbi:MAG TPA: CHAD domain-containing protein [Solirubrobacteraceae bacterium]|nr:CHAD domain-containing protein [Solirubrobacteraceae bacterium]